MKSIIKGNALPLRGIGYLKKGNAGDALRQSAIAWLERVRRKSSASPLTPNTPSAMLEVPQPNFHGMALPNSNTSTVVPSRPRRLSASTLNDEESPLLSIKKGNVLPFHHHSGVRHHLRELVKCVWMCCFGWLWKSKSAVSILQLTPNEFSA